MVYGRYGRYIYTYYHIHHIYNSCIYPSDRREAKMAMLAKQFQRAEAPWTRRESRDVGAGELGIASCPYREIVSYC